VLDDAQAARAIAEALKNPFSEKEFDTVLVKVVRARPPPPLTSQAGQWDILAWAAKQS
jgi:hypothetical protein